MAELKHRLFWINKFNNGLESVSITANDPSYEEFYLRYYNFRNDETAKNACHTVLNSLTELGILRKEQLYDKCNSYVYHKIKK